MADLTYSIDINTKQALGGIQQLQKQLNRTDKAIKKVDKSSQGFGSSLGGLKTILAGVVSGAALKGIIGVTARFEDLRTTLGSVFGSAQKGAQAFSAIQEMSTKTQFGIEDLSNTFIKLAGAGIQPTEKLLKTFTDTAAVTTDSVGTLNAMTDLFSRTTQGGLGLEELNRLGDKGIPVFEILAEKLGITRNEISEFGKSAEGARKITEALAEGLDERFGGATESRLGNLSTLMSNFSIAIKNAAGQIGEAMGPALKNLISIVTDFITKNGELANTVGEVLGSALNGVAYLLQLLADNSKLVIQAVFTLTVALGARGLGQALSAASKGFKALTLAMMRNPFGLLAVGIASLLAYLSFENGLGRTFVQIKAAVDVLGNAFGRFTTYLSDKVGGVVKWLKDRFYDFIQVLIDTYNVIARIVPGLDEVTSSSRELADAVGNKVGEALDYAAGKAGEMKDAIIDAIPPEVLEQYKDLKSAITDAGTAYDATMAKAKDAGETIAKSVSIPGIKAGGVVLAPKQTKEEIKNAKSLESAMKSLTDRLLPMKAAAEKYREETELLNAALKAGKITTVEHAAALTMLKTEYDEFLESQKTAATDWASGWSAAMDEYTTKARDASAVAKDVFTKATGGMEDAIVGFVKTGKFSFKSLMSDIADTLLRSQVKQLMANLFSGGGGGGSSIFGSLGTMLGFANGGIIPNNNPVIVGERGPEIIANAGGSRVIPNDQLGGSVNYYISAVDAQSFQALVASDPGFIHAVAQRGAVSA
tara:strand:- start:6063 stop:8345 length:2283 start_codon:yes stop_codon:yes gene_type:complete